MSMGSTIKLTQHIKASCTGIEPIAYWSKQAIRLEGEAINLDDNTTYKYYIAADVI